ncbi:acylneuraminate cytidylyltransferase [Candidatus Tenderia electrophaga]|jgi:N-acylneuraminate cytidylyltransferase|uniref:Acylneuraminate cytidylyltransferase n=1 Tax=Candidatus Tenderia electrophaga TaxID=1748243 RepID=A0A0S2TBY0_9GAMM|nr:acylneuraminate cytidylyltransferase [Candidatus Tenderia electrophaga]
MIGGHKVLGVIPARGGSKGLPRKNILPLAGKPLLAWTIATAKASRYLDRVILSSDDEEIMAVARQYGCDVPFRRPDELASDRATTMDALHHAMEQVPGYDIAVVLQPTNPLRTAADIDHSLERLEHSGAASCVTVTEPDKSPYWTFTMDKDVLTPLLGEEYAQKRRQDLPRAWVLNGCVYAVRTPWFREHHRLIGKDTVGQPMPKERSLDIDTELDLQIAELMLRSSHSTRETGT